MSDKTDELTHELTQELSELADSAVPGKGVDVARAVREGGVRLRRRRFAAFGAGAVVVASAVTVSLLPLGGGSTVRPAPAATRTTAAVPDADPIVVEASFGWLPAGFGEVSYLPDASGMHERVDGKVPAGGSTGPLVWLTVYPEKAPPKIGRTWFPGGPKQYRVAAPPVDGRPAYWVGKGPTTPWAPAGDWFLRWQTAGGQWAELQSTYLAGTGAQQTLHRIAEGVVVGHRAVPLPYRISGVPAGVKVSQADLFQSPSIAPRKDAPWTSTISFMVDGMSIDTTVQPDVAEPPKSSADAGSEPFEPKQTCVKAHGLSACTESQSGDDAYRTVGGPEGWLKKFTLLGTDQRDWTSKVLN